MAEAVTRGSSLPDAQVAFWQRMDSRWILIGVPIALVVNAVLKRLLHRAGFYRLVWHRPLFDFALFVIVLGGVATLSSRIVGITAPFFGSFGL